MVLRPYHTTSTARGSVAAVLPEAAATSASTASTSAESGPPLSSNVAAFDLPESSTNTGKKAYSAHDLALIFVVFCFGALTDPILPPAPYNVEAEQYFQLTRAAMNVEPVLDRPPSVVTVQTLSLMAIYQVSAVSQANFTRIVEIQLMSIFCLVGSCGG